MRGNKEEEKKRKQAKPQITKKVSTVKKTDTR
jgi:hypothetical protein